MFTAPCIRTLSSRAVLHVFCSLLWGDAGADCYSLGTAYVNLAISDSQLDMAHESSAGVQVVGVQVGNAKDCQARCELTTGCKYFTFFKGSRMCHLQDVSARRMRNSVMPPDLRGGDGVLTYSGPKKCGVIDPLEAMMSGVRSPAGAPISVAL